MDEVVAVAAPVTFLAFLLSSARLLWPVAGFEDVKLDGEFLTYRYGVAGIVIRRFVFEIAAMSKVRLATQAYNDLWRINLWSSKPGFFRAQRIGMLVFDYGFDPFAFGVSLSPIEASSLADQINAKMEDLHKSNMRHQPVS